MRRKNSRVSTGLKENSNSRANRHTTITSNANDSDYEEVARLSHREHQMQQ